MFQGKSFTQERYEALRRAVDGLLSTDGSVASGSMEIDSAPACAPSVDGSLESGENLVDSKAFSINWQKLREEKGISWKDVEDAYDDGSGKKKKWHGLSSVMSHFRIAPRALAYARFEPFAKAIGMTVEEVLAAGSGARASTKAKPTPVVEPKASKAFKKAYGKVLGGMEMPVVTPELSREVGLAPKMLKRVLEVYGTHVDLDHYDVDDAYLDSKDDMGALVDPVTGSIARVGFLTLLKSNVACFDAKTGKFSPKSAVRFSPNLGDADEDKLYRMMNRKGDSECRKQTIADMADFLGYAPSRLIHNAFAYCDKSEIEATIRGISIDQKGLPVDADLKAMYDEKGAAYFFAYVASVQLLLKDGYHTKEQADASSKENASRFSAWANARAAV